MRVIRGRAAMSKIADLAYQGIRQRIVRGDYAAGTHLKEEVVADEIGASRTPVREALRRLNSENLVEFVPNRGAYVASWSLEDVEEIYTLRSLLEGQAAFRAATRITDSDIKKLVASADRMDELLNYHDVRNTAAILEANSVFHHTILVASHSERLSKILAWVVEVPVILCTFEKYSDNDIERANHHHRELIDALQAGDPHWAQKVMEAHLSASQRVLIFNRQSRSN
ncbi:MAG: DNA-binding GntR family transcriptional regulator [Gammaproteobacteria bacterium]|jgi:DNA-binding GntR family transcriptional regulator